MFKGLFLILSLLLLGTACNQSVEKSDSTTPVVTAPVEDKAPTSIKYKVLNASYFKDVIIVPNLPTVNGDLESMEFSIEPALPEGLTFDAQTGAIEGTPINLMEQKFYSIKAKNDYGLVSINISIKVVIPPPENLTYSWNMSGQDVYNFTSISKQSGSVSGQVSGYCITPSLPNGLFFDANTGDISGSPQITDPTLLGRYFTYTVRAFNSTCPNNNNNCSNNCGSNSYSFKLRYLELPPTDLIYSIASPTYNIGVPIVNNCPTYQGGFVTLFVVDPVTLPAGLNFNLLNGCIQGTPLSEVATPLSYTVTAINTGGNTSAGLSLRVFSSPPTSFSYTQNNIDYTKGSVVSNQISFTGGKPTSFIIDKPLPAGLSLNSTTGAIEGIPSTLTERNTYLITATNTGGSVQTSVSLGVKDIAPVNLSYGQSSFLIRNTEPFNASIKNNTGGAVVSYSINPPLPPGLSFSTTTGEINGKPTQVQNSKSYTVLATNTGGQYSFQFNLQILPVPNYDFNYKLLEKNFLPPNNITYLFEIENRSKEYDNSIGINLSMPFSVKINSSQISTTTTDANCLNLSLFTYLQKCKIKLVLKEDSADLGDLNVELSAAEVLTKIINLDLYRDISPKDVVLSGDRGRIVKAVYNENELVVDISSPAPIEKIGETFIPLVSQDIPTTGSLKDYNNTINLQRELLTSFDNTADVLIDPDADSFPGYNLFNNLSFTSNLLVTANMNGYAANCQINPPFIVSGGCILGSFSIGGADLTSSGDFSVSIGTKEGLEQEKTRSNSIKVDVYNIRRILTYYNSNPTNPQLFKKNLVIHNNKIYSSGLTDPNASNSLTNKLLEFDPNSNKLAQITNFSNPGDDFPTPLASYEGLLFFEARTPSNLDGSTPFLLYAYDEAQSKINPIFTKTIPNDASKRVLLAKPANSLEETWSLIQGGKLWFNTRINDENTGFYNVVVSYSKSNNNIKKEISKQTSESGDDSNGLVDKSSLVFASLDNKFYFNAFMRVQSPIKNTSSGITYNGGYKLQALDISQNKQNRISRKNNDLVSDYLEQVTPYDSKLFFISRTPTLSGSGSTTAFQLEANLLKNELVYFDPVLNQIKLIMESAVVGAGNILGVHYGKLYFSMPISGNKDGIFTYDAISQEVNKIYESEVGDKIYKISRYSNYTNSAGFFFAQGPANSASKNLLFLKKSGNDDLVTTIVSRSTVFVNENTTIFSYNDTFFFSCEEGGNFKLNSLCAYNEQEKTFSLILRNVAPVSNPSSFPGQRPEALVLYNNKVYFAGFSYNPSSQQAKYGLFEMCILTESGCAP